MFTLIRFFGSDKSLMVPMFVAGACFWISPKKVPINWGVRMPLQTQRCAILGVRECIHARDRKLNL